MRAFAGTEISQFYKISFDEYVLGFYVSVKDAFAMHKFDGSEDLKHIEFDFLVGERVLLVL